MLSGAGGGCCGEASPYGFSAVHFTDDMRMETTTNVAPINPSNCRFKMEEGNLFLKSTNPHYDLFIEYKATGRPEFLYL